MVLGAPLPDLAAGLSPQTLQVEGSPHHEEQTPHNMSLCVDAPGQMVAPPS